MVIPRSSLDGLVKRLGEFGAAAGGAVAIYVAFAGVALMGALVLALDVGRLTVVRSQMQNAADAACLSAAIQLDGLSNATDRAEVVARNATVPTSDYNVSSGTSAITIAIGTNGIVFYTDSTLTTTTTVDASAAAMRVTLVARPVALLLQPALALLSSASARSFSNVDATAACTSVPIICNPPALMACNGEDSPFNTDLRADSSAGIQIKLRKPGGGAQVSPGNVSLVCPATGNCGANEILNLLAAVDNDTCTETGIDTKPGIAAQKVNRGINSRFDLPTAQNPAENIGAYLRDASFIGDYIGDANWDPATYWAAEHVGDGALPDGLQHYTRYQMYLYELDEEFARHNGNCASNGGGSDCRTIYPLADDNGDPVDLPSGFTTVDPPGVNLPDNGVPTTTPVPDPADPRRRVFRVAVVDCPAIPVTGSTFIDYDDVDIVDMFVTEPAGSPSDFVVFLEVIRSRDADDSTDIINNARLIE